MNVTLRQLRAFVAVAEHGQFTKAAEQIHLTQAALSMLIRDLEQEWGLKLFDRHTRMVRLTEGGRELLAMARRVLAEIDTAAQHSRDYALYKRGRVVLACATVLSVTLLIPFMQYFLRQYPGIRLELRDMAEQAIQQSLLDEEVDIGIGTHLESRTEIIETPLFADSYLALLPPDHVLAGARTVPWSSLSKHAFIALSPSSAIRREIERHLATLNVSLNNIYEVSFPTTVFAMVRNGMGMSVLPANASQLPEARDVVFKPLGAPKLQRQVCTFRLRHRSLSLAGELLHQTLLQYVAGQRRAGAGLGAK
jgi:DNA-binding transcriptional LysR family regulator